MLLCMDLRAGYQVVFVVFVVFVIVVIAVAVTVVIVVVVVVKYLYCTVRILSLLRDKMPQLLSAVIHQFNPNVHIFDADHRKRVYAYDQVLAVVFLNRDQVNV